MPPGMYLYRKTGGGYEVDTISFSSLSLSMYTYIRMYLIPIEVTTVREHGRVGGRALWGAERKI